MYQFCPLEDPMALLLKSIPPNPKLEKLLEWAKTYKMSDREIKEQAVSNAMSCITADISEEKKQEIRRRLRKQLLLD